MSLSPPDPTPDPPPHPSVPSRALHAQSLWPAFGLGLAVAVGNGLARFAYALLLPAMRDDLGWNYAQAGWLNTANALGYVLGAVSGYLLLRRASPRRLFAWGLWMCFVSLGATGLGIPGQGVLGQGAPEQGLVWLSAMRLAAGIGAAWVFACGGALVQWLYQDAPASRGTATGLFFAGAGLGIVASGLLVNPLLARMGAGAWPQAWVALGVLGAAASVWPLRVARRVPAAPAASARVAGDAMAWRRLAPSLAGYFCFAAGYIGYMTFIFEWLRQHALSWVFGTAVWSVLGLAVGCSPFLWRSALARWPAARTLSASSVVTLAGSVVLLISPAPGWMLVSAALFGLGVFIAPSAVAVLLRQSLPAPLIARAMALFTTAFAVGQAIGPLLAGWLADRHGLPASLWLGVALLGCAVVLPFWKAA